MTPTPASAPSPTPSRPARAPGLSVRARLTLSYAAFVVVVGLAFAVVGYLLLRFVPEGNATVGDGGFAPGRSDLLEVFVKYTGIALLVLAVIGLGGGWLLAGRMLAPLDRVTAAARLARDGSLSHRIRMPGRQDELAELADTFDEMLGRVQLAVDEQRRFAANASHELRTPHAVIRTMLEVASADPEGRDIEQLLSRIAEMNERSIVLTEALLTLADADTATDTASARGTITAAELDGILSAAVDDLSDAAAAKGVRVTLAAREATEATVAGVHGDAALLRQLVVNLVQNAVVHNIDGGTVTVGVTRGEDGAVVLEVVNTGAPLDEVAVATFTEPFTRGAGRTRSPGASHVGSGLGLAIVASIARAHAVELTLVPRPGGGLCVRVTFPR
ncbi:sensor histidine kinase [Herbiconiux solani]|uniref:sensor histidine kinase n=1 Tax=Herbiconiux solani TaxID=661329 RepID=UPI000826981C|nr:HAMP domain-containing sensor histidine kinase [Herbiconiux solani]